MNKLKSEVGLFMVNLTMLSEKQIGKGVNGSSSGQITGAIPALSRQTGIRQEPRF